jgi:hypothetical protein
MARWLAKAAKGTVPHQTDSPPVGKDFLPGSALFATAPSGSGFQVSLYGVAGLLLAVDEGFELNVLASTSASMPLCRRLSCRGSVDWGWNADVL